jgi:hypothetical protein
MASRHLKTTMSNVRTTRRWVDHSVDDLAKGQATGTVSKRKALRMLGAALVGGLPALVPEVVWAAKPAGEQGCR